AKTHVDWSKIEPLPEGTIRTYKHLEHPNNDEVIASMLNKLVVVKLNGGLGTSMGCKGPKSVIPVRNELTFLDLTLQQIQTLNKTFNVDVPLVLMNSFNTEEDTKKVLKKFRAHLLPIAISTYQSRNSMPIAKSLNDNDQECWYPPGHGNFYEAFYNSGLIDKFIADGKEYCFLSNIDNMGATVDFPILNFLLSPPAGHDHPEFLMEGNNKNSADGRKEVMIQLRNRIVLESVPKFPKEFIIFNTNNLWAKLSAIKRVVENNELEMEVIVNPKHLDRGVDIIQLETAAGAAVKNFRGAC
ncbi:UTP--glucose-1-phosphate uridylyltransferase, partial [Ostertagia ostertagi]